MQQRRAVHLLPLWLLACIAVAQSPFYNVPEPKIEALKPRGLRISIPDEPGVELFAVHANVNKPMQNLEAGQISVDINKPKNGRWVYEDIRVRLKPGDVINYWLYVQADGLGYRKDDQTFKVTELVDPGASETPSPPTPSPTPSPVTQGPPPEKTEKPTNPIKCGSTVTTVNGQPACKGQLIFEDNFSSLNPSKWQHMVQIAYAPDYQFVVYTENRETAFVKDHHLFIKPKLLSSDSNYIYTGKLFLPTCTGIPDSPECEKQSISWSILPPVESAKLQTKLSFSFLYGVIEIRAKLPLGDWLFPELWLEPKENFYGRDSYQSGQVRIAMARGNEDLTKNGIQFGNRRLEAGCRIGLNGKIRNEMHTKDYPQSLSSDFHVYKVIWAPDRLLFTIDGNEVGTVQPPLGGFGGYEEFASETNPWRSKLAPFDREFYISLGVGVGGNDEFPDGSTSHQHAKPWRNKEVKAMLKFYRDKDTWYSTWDQQKSALEVDYVKVWAL